MKGKQYNRDIDVLDDNDKLLGTIKNASSYRDAIIRSKTELKLPFTNYRYTYRNTYYRTGKYLGN